MSIPVDTVLVDFDGTACRHDVAEHLLTAFGDEGWEAHDDAVDRHEIGVRDAIVVQDAMLHADRDTMLAFALEHCPVDPTFVPFVRWLDEQGIRITIVSDGFGFYVEPLLETVGLGEIDVITNEQTWNANGYPAGMRFVNGHAECVGCGTCKMKAVLDHRTTGGAVAFVGDGQSDRYAAIYADVTFAKHELVAHCERDGVPYLPWNTFDDVRRSLETLEEPPGPVSPLRCPGWTLPTDLLRPQEGLRPVR